jgi:hypothetical protein
MISESDQVLRHWLDQILQITAESLQKRILTAYKTKYPHNYMVEMREKLSRSGMQYPADIFASEDLLIAQLRDPMAWLNLMQKRWEVLFDRKSGVSGKDHVATLLEIRHKWAHHNPISKEHVALAAETAINLLRDFQCGEGLQLVRDIQLEIVNKQAAAPLVLAEQSAPSAPNVFLLEDATQEPAPEDTELVQPIREGHEWLIEMIEGEGTARQITIPFGANRVIVGRGSIAHIGLNDPKVSRVHCMLTPNSKTGLLLTDLHSANGTILKGTRLRPNESVHWESGQVITIGNTWLILRRGGS